MPPSIVHHPFSYLVGPFQLTGFGLAVLLAFMIAQITTGEALTERGRDPSVTSDCIIAAVVGGLIGAKVYYAILTGDISNLFHRSGFVFWGGLIGGVVSTAALVKMKGWSIPQISDACAPGLAAAYSIGRTGCWAVGDDYGRWWPSRWGVAFPEGAPPSTAENLSQLFHVQVPAGVAPSTVLSVYPTQLFEVTLGFFMFLVLWRFRNHRHAAGWLFGFYFLLAGIERFLIEFLRAKDDHIVGPFTTAQYIAIAAAVAGAALMYARRNVTASAEGIYAEPAAAHARP